MKELILLVLSISLNLQAILEIIREIKKDPNHKPSKRD